MPAGPKSRAPKGLEDLGQGFQPPGFNPGNRHPERYRGRFVIRLDRGPAEKLEIDDDHEDD
jgi:hypothetical protein